MSWLNWINASANPQDSLLFWQFERSSHTSPYVAFLIDICISSKINEIVLYLSKRTTTFSWIRTNASFSPYVFRPSEYFKLTKCDMFNILRSRRNICVSFSNAGDLWCTYYFYYNHYYYLLSLLLLLSITNMFILCMFFIRVLSYGFSLKSECQQFHSGLKSPFTISSLVGMVFIPPLISICR